MRDMSARRSHDRPQPTTSARAPFVARLAVALVAVGLVTFLTWWGIRRWPALTAPKIGEGAPNATANGNKPANGDENPTLDVEVSSSATAPLLTPRMAATGGDWRRRTRFSGHTSCGVCRSGQIQRSGENGPKGPGRCNGEEASGRDRSNRVSLEDLPTRRAVPV